MCECVCVCGNPIHTNSIKVDELAIGGYRVLCAVKKLEASTGRGGGGDTCVTTACT